MILVQVGPANAGPTSRRSRLSFLDRAPPSPPSSRSTRTRTYPCIQPCSSRHGHLPCPPVRPAVLRGAHRSPPSPATCHHFLSRGPHCSPPSNCMPAPHRNRPSLCMPPSPAPSCDSVATAHAVSPPRPRSPVHGTPQGSGTIRAALSRSPPKSTTHPCSRSARFRK